MIHITDVIYSPTMIEALWRGDKRMTRRLSLTAKGKPSKWQKLYEAWQERGEDDRFFLWVRETWARTPVAPIVASIDEPMLVFAAADTFSDYGGPWKPAIHMRRADSRSALLITDIREEPLYAITPEDVLAEGVRGQPAGYFWARGQIPDRPEMRGWLDDNRTLYAHPNHKGKSRCPLTDDPVFAFRWLWESLHGAGSWAENPSVIVLSFEHIKCNVDVHVGQLGEAA